VRAKLPHRIAVLGGGESGIGAALLAAHRGVDVFLSEGKNLGPGYRAELEAAGIPCEEGQHSLDQLLTAEAVVKSPGIPPSHPIVAALKQAGVPIWSDIEWFYMNCPASAKIAAITGSNGKTTTTSWLGHILRQAGANVQVGGNIGVGAGRLLLAPDADVYVLEVSSYQLEDCPSFRPDVAVLTNITPDHLDRYGSLEAYAETKFAIAQHQRSEDAFVFYGEDPVSQRYLERVAANLYPIYTSEPATLPAQGAAPIPPNYLIRTADSEMTIDELALQGKHNTFNALAAGLSARLLQVRDEAIRESLAHFEGLEHRMESVAHVGGIHFINDSKATNVNSTYYALESMTTPTVLILGGVDKGNDYSELFRLVEKKVKAIVAMGTDNHKIVEAFEGRVSLLAETASMEHAVRTAYQLASKGDTVLLSPCCASFDLFQNYEDRGRQFKTCVRAL
jgi:UDP-N-acetylmuramoylalanine--D-glutamate ligase